MIFSALFFADPDLIGPSLYPSSSVMRFFWCYIFVAYYVLFPVFNFKRYTFIVFIWILSILWSFESAFYTTVIFFTATLMQFYLEFKKSCNITRRKILLFILPPIISLILMFIAISLFYKIKLNVFPDFRCFYEYALGYGKGFGSVELNLLGPGVYLIVFNISLLTVMMYSNIRGEENFVSFIGIVSCLWGITSYYVGRSVPNNITAVLPIIGMLMYISVLLLKDKSQDFNLILYKLIIFPILFLITQQAISLNVFNSFFKWSSFDNHIESRLYQDNKLEDLIKSIHLDPNENISYYGDAAAISTLNNRYPSNTFIMAPMQLLQEPISEKRKIIYLKRYVTRHLAPGYLIHKLGESEVEYAKWLELIHQFFHETYSVTKNGYIIKKFEPQN